MLARVEIGGRKWTVQCDKPDFDLCVPVRPYADQNTVPDSFFLPKSDCEPTKVGYWVGSVDQGASVNVPTVHLCVHGSGTHTECIGHITAGDINLGDLDAVPPFLPATVLSVRTERLGDSGETYDIPKASKDDVVVTKRAVQEALARTLGASLDSGFEFEDVRDSTFVEAVVLRVAGFEAEQIKPGHSYSGKGFPFLTTDAIDFLCKDLGMKHLLINLPSVDREDDDGALLNHRAVFRFPAGTEAPDIESLRAGNGKLPLFTVTEHCAIPQSAAEGRVLLSLQVSPIQLDAAPSRPLLFYLNPDSQKDENAADEGALRRMYAAAGQDHVFKYLQTLPAPEKDQLLDQLRQINPQAVLDQYARTTAKSKKDMSGGIENCRPTRLDLAGEADKLAWYKTAMRAIGAGEVGVILLAGGQGTRLGFAKPKGCFPGSDSSTLSSWIPSGKTLFQLQAQRILKLQRMAADLGGPNALIHWYIMTSPMTHQETLENLETNNYYGLQPTQVHLFQQGTLPCIADTPEGPKFIIKNPSELASAPDGNGGIYKALHTYGGRGGMIAHMESNGVRHLFTNAVDNSVCKIADPLFLGFCIASDVSAGNKVTEKREPHEKVGLQCIRNGCYEVVEYSDIDPRLCEQRDETGKLAFSSGSVCIHYYSLNFLKKECHPDNLASALHFHIARKAIPEWNDEAGAAVKPLKPNGVKLETFIFDVFKLARSKFGVFEVQREEEFAPIKNASGVGVKDSPVTAVLQMSQAQKRWIEAAGGKLINSDNDACDVEISPLVSYSGEGLRELVEGRTLKCPFMIVEADFCPPPGSRAEGGTVTKLSDNAILVEISQPLVLPAQ